MSSLAARRLCLVTLVAVATSAAAAETMKFEKVVLDPEIGKVCYAVTAADVDGDSKLDAVAISEREAVWYRNPDWRKHTMIRDAVPTDHVCIAAGDIDSDGQVDFALGAGWPKNGGSIHWLHRGKTLDQPWQVHSISAEPWTHRMRFANVLGLKQDQLVVSPLNGDGDAGIRLLAFPIPADPIAGPWKPVVMDGSLHRAHNHWHPEVLREGNTDATLVASEEGLSVVKRKTDGGFSLTKIASGASSDDPSGRGSGEIKTGRLASQRLLATIEPMHGNQVVAYVGQAIDSGLRRIVLDDSFVQGHAVWCADIDNDGNDEIIAAYREPSKQDPKGPGIYIYRATDSSGLSWTRQLLDAPMACEDVWCADFNGDGRVDILAGGRATHDVNLYLNQTVAESTSPSSNGEAKLR